MKNLTLILMITLSISVIGQTNKIYENFNRGSFQVGFKELHTIDYSRIYKDDFRTIQIALWYPIDQPLGDKVKIVDYLELLNSEDSSEDEVQTIDFWKNQFTRINETTSAEDILNSSSLAFLSSTPTDSKYPLILYAAGGQGESFENFLICEILASNGFVVAAIPSIGTYIHPIEINQEGLMAQTQDLKAVLRYLNQEPYIDFKNVGAFGWSWGGLSTLYLQTLYPHINAFVSLDGSIAGYQHVIEKMPYYAVEKIIAPSLYFATSEDTKVRAKKYVDQLIYSNSTFISLDSIQHNNFNSYSYVSQVFDSSKPNQNVLKFYPFLVNKVSDFFIHHLKNGKKNIYKLENDLPLIDTLTHKAGVEPPLREDQLITLIKDKGAEFGVKEYRKMKNLNSKYVPFEAFELTKVAFSLVRDSERTDESILVMNMVIEEYPKSASSFALRGRVHEIRNENKQALADFKSALALKLTQNQSESEEVVFYEDVNWYKKKIKELEKK